MFTDNQNKMMSTNNQNNRLGYTDRSIFPEYIYLNEIRRKQSITYQDKESTLRLLREFHISPPSDFEIICSEFTTYADLENWRRNYILKNMPNFPTL